MIMRHLLLEVYCDYTDSKSKNSCCLKGDGTISTECFKEKCKHLSFTKTENELAYAGESELVENNDEYIGFGGDMEPENDNYEKRDMLLTKWKEICKKKLDEAYNEYMAYKKQVE